MSNTKSVRLVFMDESGDTGVNVYKKRSKSRYFIEVAYVQSPFGYRSTTSTRGLVKDVVEELEINEDAKREIIEKLSRLRELKSKSVTEIIAKVLRDKEKKSDNEINEVIDTFLFEVIKRAQTDETYYIIVYVDKAKFTEGIKNYINCVANNFGIYPLSINYDELLRHVLSSRLRKELCEYLEKNYLKAIVMFDEKLFIDIRKDDIPRDKFQCKSVLEAIEVKSHHVGSMFLVDVLAAAIKNALLHGNSKLRQLITSRGILHELTDDLLRVLEGCIGSHRGA